MAGKYQAYPEYKDSGVEWLGDVPEHWNLTRIKYIAELTPRKPNIQRNLQCSFVPMEKLKTNSIVLDEERLIDDVYDGYTYFQDKDILMAKVTPCFENKNIAIAKELINKIGFGSSEIYVLRVNVKASNRYLYYRLQEDSFMDLATAAMTGAGGLKRVPSDVVNNFTAAVPFVDEQEKIANFLDHETAKIDTLIEKQQQLIQLLKEKRQAVISHAVTKGLNPDVPMRDSGVEWLGEVPEHWDRKVKLSNLAESNRGSFVNGPFGSDLLANELIDDGIPVIYIRDLKRTGYKRKSTVCVSEEKAKQLDVCKVQTGDVLISKVGDPPGDACVYPENEPDAIITQDVIRIRVDRKVVTPFFLTMLLNSDFGQMVINDISVEGTRKRVSLGDFKATRFILPSLNEQEDIVAFVVEQCKKMDNLIAISRSAVELIKERRTALISAAVTGKIDVRNWVAPAHP